MGVRNFREVGLTFETIGMRANNPCFDQLWSGSITNDDMNDITCSLIPIIGFIFIMYLPKGSAHRSHMASLLYVKGAYLSHRYNRKAAILWTHVMEKKKRHLVTSK